MFLWLIVQHAADRITVVGPAFSTEEAARIYADTLPEEWHASVDRIHLDPKVEPYMSAAQAEQRRTQ